MTTTTDRLVTDDLAALAIAKRRGLRGVDDTMRALAAAARPAATATATGAIAGELALLAMATVFARRVARATTGAVLLACSAITVVMLTNPYDVSLHDDAGWWGDVSAVGVVVQSVLLALLVRPIARWIGEAIFEHCVRDARARGLAPIDVASRLVRAVDGPSLALDLAGAAALGIVAVVIWIVLDDSSIPSFWFDRGPFDGQALWGDRVRDLAIAVPVVAIAAIAVGRACARESTRPSRWLAGLARRRAIALAAAAVVATLVVATACVQRDLDILRDPRGGVAVVFAFAPSSPLRTALTAAGSIAWFVGVAGAMLARRRAERDRIAS